MESFIYEEEQEEKTYGQESHDDEDDYLKGFEEEEEVEECAECGSALRDNCISKEIAGEVLKFCCEACVKDYEDSIGQ
jgi:hypothetical protein